VDWRAVAVTLAAGAVMAAFGIWLLYRRLRGSPAECRGLGLAVLAIGAFYVLAIYGTTLNPNRTARPLVLTGFLIAALPLIALFFIVLSHCRSGWRSAPYKSYTAVVAVLLLTGLTGFALAALFRSREALYLTIMQNLNERLGNSVACAGYIAGARIYLIVVKNGAGDCSAADVRNVLHAVVPPEQRVALGELSLLGFEPPITGNLRNLDDVDGVIEAVLPRIRTNLRHLATYSRGQASVGVLPVTVADGGVSAGIAPVTERERQLADGFETGLEHRLSADPGGTLAVVDGRQRLRESGIPLSALDYLDPYWAFRTLTEVQLSAAIMTTLVRPASGTGTPGPTRAYGVVVRMQVGEARMDVMLPESWAERASKTPSTPAASGRESAPAP
jgi:hypothetical protein